MILFETPGGQQPIEGKGEARPGGDGMKHPVGARHSAAGRAASSRESGGGVTRWSVTVCSERPVLRAGIARLVREWLPGEAEVLEAESRRELLHLLMEYQPQVAVIDVEGGFDLTLLRSLQDAARGCRYVLLARQLTPELLYHMTESGCCSVVCEKAAVDLLRTTVLAALEGETRIDPAVLPEGYTEERIPLSQRESELVELLAQGMKNREIAEALNLSVGTVKVYLSHLFNKLHVKDRFELALCALRNTSTLGARVKPPGAQTEMEGAGETNAVILDWYDPADARMRTAGGRGRMAK